MGQKLFPKIGGFDTFLLFAVIAVPFVLILLVLQATIIKQGSHIPMDLRFSVVHYSNIKSFICKCPRQTFNSFPTLFAFTYI